MPCPSYKIDSNVTGLSFAEEECLKQLPGVGGADAIWRALEPNSYSDFGGQLSLISRSTINPSRQNQKGVITDLDASGGFNMDYTANNFARLLQGFFFADAREQPSTAPLATATSVTLTGVTTTEFQAASGLNIFAVDDLIVASGFTNAANNGVKTVASVAAGAVGVDETLVAETPPATAALRRVGWQLASGDVDAAVTSGLQTLTSTTTDFTAMGLVVGQWLFIGGDTASTAFSVTGFARIKTIAANLITFDDATFALTESGAGKTIHLFAGTVIKNENVANLVKRRSYSIERTLGEGATDTQAEYLEGAVANEFTFNVPTADKITADLAFVATDNSYRSGESGDEIKAGTRIAALGETAFNTSSDIYRIKMSLLDPATSSPTALFGYVTDFSVNINNGITPNKAVGVLGAFDTTAGNFTVGGSVTAFFTSTSACAAVRANSDVALSIIGSSTSANAGFVFDIPLLALGGGRITVEKDAPITVPLEPSGAENAEGYTLLYECFHYLPDAAQPAAA